MPYGSEFESDEWQYCLMRSSDGSGTGKLRRRNGLFEFTLFSREPLDQFLNAKELTLITETNEFILLYHIFGTGIGSTFGAERYHRLTGYSSLAYVTSDPNPNLSQIKRLNFRSEFSTHHISNREKAKSINLEEIFDADTTILAVTCNDFKVSINWGFEFSFRGPATLSDPWIEIEFSKPETWNVANGIAFRIMALFSGLKGEAIGMSDFSLELFDSDQPHRVYEDQEDRGVPRVGRFFPAMKIQKSRNPEKFPILTVYDDESAGLFSEVLQYWLLLDASWDDAIVALLKYARHENTFSGDRLLDACRWLEDIPTSRPLRVLDDNEFDIKIGSVIKAIAEKHLRERASGALKNLRFESHRDRISRLVSKLCIDGIDEQELVSRVVFGLRLRGKYAHGHAATETQDSFEKLVDATTAIELLCFVLMFENYFPRFRYGVREHMHPISNYLV